MSAREEQFCSAYVLHRRPYREHQLIVDLLTAEHGKLSVIVHNGKSLKSSKKAQLQAFTLVDIVFKGHAGLKTLVRIDKVAKPLALTDTYLYSAFYLNELVIKLLDGESSCPSLFEHYHRSLHELAEQRDLELTLRLFELELLNELGLSFDYSVVAGESAMQYHYLTEQGFVPVEHHTTLPCYQGEHLVAIAQQDYHCPAVKNTFKRLMRQVISELLDGRPLNSRKLFIK